MARAPSWKKLIRTKEQVGAVKAKPAGKSPRDKMLEAIDKQIANLKDGTLGSKATWHTAAGAKGYRVKPRYGTTSLNLHDEDIYVYDHELEAFLKGLREDIAAGNMDAELERISNAMSESKRGKAAKA